MQLRFRDDIASDLRFYKVVNFGKSNKERSFSHFFNILAGTSKIALLWVDCHPKW